MKIKNKDGGYDLYSTNLPMTSVHNLILGKLYTDTSGKVTVKNHVTEDYVEFEYLQRGWKNKTAFCVEGTVKNAEGKAFYKVEGKWNTSIFITNLETG